MLPKLLFASLTALVFIFSFLSCLWFPPARPVDNAEEAILYAPYVICETVKSFSRGNDFTRESKISRDFQQEELERKCKFIGEVKAKSTRSRPLLTIQKAESIMFRKVKKKGGSHLLVLYIEKMMGRNSSALEYGGKGKAYKYL